MKHKHIYEAPQAQVLQIEAGSMIAAAASMRITDDTTDDDARMSKKHRQSWDSIWD